MDKSVIFAVAGSGKTTCIISRLTLDSRSLIITYTNNNIENLRKKIIKKFGFFPANITLLSYFTFLYSFCFKPFLSYKIKTKGIDYKSKPYKYAAQKEDKYYIKNSRLFSHRISKLLITSKELNNILERLYKYFDNLYIDEIQDLAGNDFNFLKEIVKANINVLLVGDFYQHTFDTSRDGNVNKSIHKDFDKYKKLFRTMGLTVDTISLDKSYRCSPDVCNFISDNLKIKIKSHKNENSIIKLVEDKKKAYEIFKDDTVIKLFYKNSHKYNCSSRNWGGSKGEDKYIDVCVVLNQNTMKHYSDLSKLSPQTINKLYVACSRAHRNLYFVDKILYKNI